MNEGNELKKLERRATAMLLDKEIPPATMEIVRSMIHNNEIMPEERYRAIIELVQSCPDRAVKEPVSTRRISRNKRNKAVPPKKDIVEEAPAYDAPTETSYFINDIHARYRHLKLFKKRYLVHRNNRIGIGVRKRLIPGKRMLKILREVVSVQENIISRLTVLLHEILNDEYIDDPLIFNYMRNIRRWLLDQPLVKYPYDSLKWMERQTFERELKAYVVNYYSFLKLDGQTRESIILMMENKLRMIDELRKEDVLKHDSDQSRAAKEKRNLDRERKVYEYIMAVRSFLPVSPFEDNMLSRKLKNSYNIDHFTVFLNSMLEALVYQRPFSEKELNTYFDIHAPVVSKNKWDYSEDILKKVGKDPESQRRKEINALKMQLEPYETMHAFLQYEDNGRDILMLGVDEQWRLVDKKRFDPEIVYKENFFNFLDGVINYFNNKYRPLMDGSTVEFMDAIKERIEGSLFRDDYFNEEMSALSSILNEMHFFRSNNPTLAITRNEVKKIMKGHIQSMSHVQGHITMIGDFFYRLAKKFLQVYDAHCTWVMRGKHLGDVMEIRTSLVYDAGDEDLLSGRPVPYHDCTIKGFQHGGSLSSRLEGMRIITESLHEGVLVHMIAFTLQACHECMNERLARDLDERKRIWNQIKALEKR